VREAEDVRMLPVLVITGLENLNADRAMALGADEFLAKPISPRVLVDTVVRILAQPAGGSIVKELSGGGRESNPGP
jgi:FixJ family two-component response regulator